MSMCSDTKELILEKIFEPAQKILQKHIDEIVLQNRDKTKDSNNLRFHMFPAKYGFTHNNIVFLSTQGKDLASNPNNLKTCYKFNPLDAELINKYKEIEQLYLLIEKNMRDLPRLFTCLLRGAKSFTDIQNQLPDEICKLIDLIGDKTTEFKVPEPVQPLWLRCKDDLFYLLSLRVLIT